METEPDNLVLVPLREMRARQDTDSARLERVEEQLRHVDKQIDDLHKIVVYSLGQTTETQFRQSQQQSKMDEMFAQLEKLLSSKEPV
ncbi:MAG: hypothetical protein JO366_21625, partial [Methylobacteriaceae bacterium]|nr:hypothetical protein [Methylobacteriaceae bacterium]